MSFLKKLFGRKEKVEEERDAISELLLETRTREGEYELPEIPIESEEVIYVKPYRLRGLEDVDTVIKEVVEENNIVILDLSMLSKDRETIRRVIERLRGAVATKGGDMGRIPSERVILTPKFVRIWKRGTG